MHVREWGEGERIALLIHGLGASSKTWEKLAEDLADQGYHVYAPDLHGHGDSPRQETYSIQSWSEILTTQYPTVDLLVGHSLGALIATKIRNTLTPHQTILIDPVYRLPAGKNALILTQLGFKLTLQRWAKNKRSSEQTREEILKWDRKTVKALRTLTQLPKPDDTTLILRAKNSYIAPLSAFKALSKAKILTIQSGHNIHHENYPAVQAALKEFLHIKPALPAII